VVCRVVCLYDSLHVAFLQLAILQHSLWHPHFHYFCATFLQRISPLNPSNMGSGNDVTHSDPLSSLQKARRKRPGDEDEAKNVHILTQKQLQLIELAIRSIFTITLRH